MEFCMYPVTHLLSCTKYVMRRIDLDMCSIAFYNTEDLKTVINTVHL